MNDSAAPCEAALCDAPLPTSTVAKPLAPTPWILRGAVHRAPHLRLYCFSYGGGGASAFAAWSKRLDPRIELCPLQLPGRENRRAEQPLIRIDEVYRFFEEVIRHGDRRPFAFFGYCMGGRIAMAVARHLRRKHLPLPAAMFIAATREPSFMPRKAIPTYRLNDEDLLRFAQRFVDLPASILKQPELSRRMLGLLRADLELSETVEFPEEAPFEFPLTIFGGRQDTVVRIEHLVPWKEHSSGPFTLQLLDGQHMFLDSQCDAIHAQIGPQLRQLL